MIDICSKNMLTKFALIFFVLLSAISGNSQTLFIVYTSNLNGYLEPCNCQQAYLGGMTRLVTAVDSLQRIHPDMILIDSGDFFKSYPLQAGNWLMLEMMDSLDYDAIALGDQEFVDGIEFLLRGLDHFGLPVLTDNLQFKTIKERPGSAFITLQKGDYKIGVVNLTDSASFDYSMIEVLSVVPEQKILNEILQQIHPNVDLLLLLYHGSFDRAVGLAERFPEIDVVIAGHTQERAVKNFGNQMVVQSGFDGEYLGILEIDFRDSKYVFKNSFLPIDETFGENPHFKDRIRQTISGVGSKY